MKTQEMIELVENMMAAETCCRDAAEAGKNWIESVGTDHQNAEAEKLIKELEEDIMPIDGVIAFMQSEKAMQMLGKDKAAGIEAHAEAVKQAGGKYCDCQACSTANAILKNRDALLKTH